MNRPICRPACYSTTEIPTLPPINKIGKKGQEEEFYLEAFEEDAGRKRSDFQTGQIIRFSNRRSQ
jgi:hypothetical protein